MGTFSNSKERDILEQIVMELLMILLRQKQVEFSSAYALDLCFMFNQCLKVDSMLRLAPLFVLLFAMQLTF